MFFLANAGWWHMLHAYEPLLVGWMGIYWQWLWMTPHLHPAPWAAAHGLWGADNSGTWPSLLQASACRVDGELQTTTTDNTLPTPSSSSHCSWGGLWGNANGWWPSMMTVTMVDGELSTMTMDDTPHLHPAPWAAACGLRGSDDSETWPPLLQASACRVGCGGMPMDNNCWQWQWQWWMENYRQWLRTTHLTCTQLLEPLVTGWAVGGWQWWQHASLITQSPSYHNNCQAPQKSIVTVLVVE